MTDILSVGGDSGAWVIDNASGRVCAHVLAWSARNNTAYIAPMEILLNDMTQVLGADVTLPGSQCSKSTMTHKETSQGSSSNHHPIDPSPGPQPPMFAPASLFQQQQQRLQTPQGSKNAFDLSPNLNSDLDSTFNPSSPNLSPPFNHFLQQQQQQQHHRNPYPTPSPSPPMATSPPCHPLIDNIVLQQPSSSNIDPLSQFETTKTAGGATRSQVLSRGGAGGAGGGSGSGRGRGRGRGRGVEVDGMRAGSGVETRG